MSCQAALVLDQLLMRLPPTPTVLGQWLLEHQPEEPALRLPPPAPLGLAVCSTAELRVEVRALGSGAQRGASMPSGSGAEGPILNVLFPRCHQTSSGRERRKSATQARSQKEDQMHWCKQLRQLMFTRLPPLLTRHEPNLPSREALRQDSCCRFPGAVAHCGPEQGRVWA